MTRTHIASLLVLIIGVPAAAAASYFTANATPERPCFIAGNAAYRISDSAAANYTVRVDNAAAASSLHMQLVDDPAVADFVLVDDDGINDCKAATSVKSIRVDATAPTPDLTVALSRQPAATKIYVRSANFSEQDAAAMFAVIWNNSRQAAAGRQLAKRN